MNHWMQLWGFDSFPWYKLFGSIPALIAVWGVKFHPSTSMGGNRPAVVIFLHPADKQDSYK
jgi:hypothetical protein